jgi:hypothetical protein
MIRIPDHTRAACGSELMAEPMKSLATRTPRTILPTGRFLSHYQCKEEIGGDFTLLFNYNLLLTN